MRGHKLRIQRDGSLNSLDEHINRNARHGDDVGGVLHTSGVTVGTEDGDCVVAGEAEGFESFVGLLAVV
jgi:hypothetical protein